MSLSTGRIAVVGATGVVGREVLSILEQRRVPASNILALASARSAGLTIPYAGTLLVVQEATPAGFSGVKTAIFAASSGVARALAPHAIEAGATVVDNSSAFRMRPDVPLVVPEINSHLIVSSAGPRPVPLVANPNCSTIILLLAIEPLRRRFGVRSIVVSTYQAVSGAGQAGLDALAEELDASRGAGFQPARSTSSPFPEPCFLNVFSHNAAVDPTTGLNGEEQKIIDESRKILGDPALAVSPTCVRVPVMRAHSESITLRLTSPATYAEALAAYEGFPGVHIIDDRAANQFPTPLKAAGTDDVLVGRLRPDPAYTPDAQGRSEAWCLFACGDQLRKGAALNAVQIAELIS
jgi:aspartate-semialdehyde dehydrogenase